MSHRAAISDDQLLGVELRTDDPSSVVGLSRDKPRLEARPTILMEYHLPNSTEAVRCCDCESRTPHWNGFVIEATSGLRHLIGSSCGPKHLGLSFGQARTAFKSQIARQSLLRRIAAMRERIGDNLAYEGVSHKIGPLLEAEEAFKRGAPNLYQELRRLVERGDSLTQTVMVRDFEAEIRTDSDNQQFKAEKRAIAKVEGDGFLRARTLTDTLSGRRRAFAMLVHLLAAGTDKLSDRDLRIAVQRVGDADEESAFAISSLRSAHRFFSPQNFSNIQNADLMNVHELPTLNSKSFTHSDRLGRTVAHTIPIKTKLPNPPSVYPADNST